MTFSYQVTARGYANLWAKAEVRPNRVQMAHHWATVIGDGDHRPHYQAAEARTGVPWFFIGLLDLRESNCRLQYLGNGEPLNRVTRLVPAGRGPFRTFEDGAVDALKYEHFIGITDWPISRLLWAAEKFNGEGYFEMGINDPYVWSWTTLYGTPPNTGKFIGDRQFSRSEIDQQPGIAAVLKLLIKINPDVAAHFEQHKEPTVTTTTAPVAPPMATISLTQIEHTIATMETVLPMIATFVPAAAPFLALVPVADGLLKAAIAVQSGGDWHNTVATEIEAIAKQIRAMGQQTAAPPVNPLGMG